MQEFLDNWGELSVANLWHTLSQLAAWHKFQPIVPSFKRELTAKIVFIDNLEIDKLIGTIFKKQKNQHFHWFLGIIRIFLLLLIW
jgi:hypothetical protein